MNCLMRLISPPSVLSQCNDKSKEQDGLLAAFETNDSPKGKTQGEGSRSVDKRQDEAKSQSVDSRSAGKRQDGGKMGEECRQEPASRG